jgi:hypothetical protein
MKPTKLPATFLFVILLAVVIGLAACSSTGIQRSEKATTTMQTMDNDIKLIAVQLDATGASLNELTKPGQSDVKKAFELYTDNVTKIEKMEKTFTKHTDEMKARGKDYFEEWQKDGNKYKNPQIQELSEQRRIELDEIYSKIAESSVGVKNAFKSYVSDVKEIQSFLSNDLTPKGIEAIAPTTKKVNIDGENFKIAIKNIQPPIDKARAAMAHNGN